MALTYSVTQFLADMRQRTDNEGTSAADRFGDAECVGYLNRAVWAFWRVMVESRGGNFKVSADTVTTIPSVSLYSLNSSFYRLLNVNATIDNRKQWLVPFDENERAALSDTNVGWSGKPFRYSLVGSNIEFLPVPTAAFVIEVRFVPDPPLLTIGDSFDCVSGDGVNFIVDSASVYMAEKDENFELAGSLKSSAAKLEQALAMSLPNRDQNFPPRIQNVRHLSRGGYSSRNRWGR